MPPKTDQADDKRQAAREVIDILQEISDLLVRALRLFCAVHVSPVCTKLQLQSYGLKYNRGKELLLIYSQNTNLDRTELSLCVSLIENGVNPDALAVRVFPPLHSP
jgi:mitotic-spindle organizing protein 1